jgi:hypothetical protein
VSSDATEHDLGPGLHVLREADPLKRAGVLAARLRADLCATRSQAEAALEARSQLPLVDVTTLSTLEVLARRMARAERIAARTRERAVDEVGQRLAGDGAGLAVHPTTIRDRAAAVETARAAHAAAEQELAAHLADQAAREERAAVEASAAAAPPPVAAAAVPEPAGPSLHVRRSRAIGAIVAALGAGLVLLAVDAAPLWAALLPALAASLWAMRYLTPSDGDDDAQALATTSSFLAAVGASTDEVFGARRAARDAGEQTALLTSRRDRAHEDVRVAERTWHDLAGADTDVDDLDEVVRRFDPQHEDARLLAAETVGVRAADVVLHHFQQRWLAFWRELGRDAPTAAAGEAAVQALGEQVRRPIVLVGPATPLGADLARVAPAAPVVVLDGPADDGT